RDGPRRHPLSVGGPAEDGGPVLHGGVRVDRPTLAHARVAVDDPLRRQGLSHPGPAPFLGRASETPPSWLPSTRRAGRSDVAAQVFSGFRTAVSRPTG